ncbi:MAG: nucleotidyltransferase domain-containing protein [Candidatus Micrarchaeia archaeon]|jgi:predicted nucleotidyltransferase
MEQPQAIAEERKKPVKDHLGPHVENIRRVFDTIEQENDLETWIKSRPLSERFAFYTNKDKRRGNEPQIHVVPAFSFPLSTKRKSALKALQGKFATVKALLDEQHPLLFNRYPFLASKDPTAVAERIGKVAGIIRELKQQHPDEVVGVNVFGSTSRGYMNEESDLDYYFIGSHQASTKFYKRLKDEKIRTFKSKKKTLGPKNRHSNALFTGLFIGDKDELRRLQVEKIRQMSPAHWKRVARQTYGSEKNLDKLLQRHGIAEEKGVRAYIEAINSLNRVPPANKDALIKELKKSPQYKKHFD